MSKALRRRALFALPVALPVAAVAAKVAPLVSAPKPYAVGEVIAEELHIMSGDALAYEKIKQQLLTIFRDLQTLPPGTYWCPDTNAWRWPVPLGPAVVGIDAGDNDDAVAVVAVRSEA